MLKRGRQGLRKTEKGERVAMKARCKIGCFGSRKK
jgi:hypothetical protein